MCYCQVIERHHPHERNTNMTNHTAGESIKRFDMAVIDYAYMEDCRSESVIGEVSGGNYVLHSDYLAEVERLQVRVAELYDLIKYAQVESGVCMCGDNMQGHNQASGHSPVDVWDHAVEQVDKGGTSEAFIKRKQADAVESALQSEMAEFRLYNGTKRSGCFAQDLAAYAQRLRNDAGSVRGDL